MESLLVFFELVLGNDSGAQQVCDESLAVCAGSVDRAAKSGNVGRFFNELEQVSALVYVVLEANLARDDVVPIFLAERTGRHDDG